MHPKKIIESLPLCILMVFSTFTLLDAGRENASSQTFQGNGGSGFGGTVGKGALTISSKPNGDILFHFERGPGRLDGTIVFYFDTGNAGYSNTGTFLDEGDDLRRAISNGREILEFSDPEGFRASYAAALNYTFAGLWRLRSGENNAHDFLKDLDLQPAGNPDSPSHQFSLNLQELGLPIQDGTSFRWLAVYLDAPTAYSSNEAFGGSVGGTNFQNPPNPGHSNYSVKGAFSFRYSTP